MIRRIIRFCLKPVRKCLLVINPLLVKFGAASKFGARCYYTLFNSSFSREQKVFLSGRKAYQSSLTHPEGNFALLRRNVHRLEKGILMKPRRVPFGLKYISETVQAYSTACCRPDIDSTELQWASDVLSEYFRISPDDVPLIRQLRQKFTPNVRTCSNFPEPLIPYERDLIDPAVPDYDSLMRLAVHRRSVRWFLQKPVPREIIDKAIELAAQAPSACNRQPFEFRIIDDPELVQKVISIPFGLAGYGHNVPCVTVIVGKQRNYFSERDRHLIYIDGSLAAMGYLFALESQGVSSCCVNWPDIAFNDDKMAKLLKLEADERPIMLVALGYPDPQGMVARSTKKSLPSLRRYNFE
jgi:nitroreductase